MRNVFLLFVVCAATLLAPSSLFAQTPAPAASLGDDPATFDQQIDTAYLKHDVAFIAALVADDASFPAESPIRRHSGIANH